MIVSNGDHARYGSITSEWGHFAEWKRLAETDTGSLDAEVLLNGMLAHDRLLDIVENFVLFDESKPGATRKVIARNHPVYWASTRRWRLCRCQEELKLEYPLEQRLRHRVVELPLESGKLIQESAARGQADVRSPFIPEGPVDILERAHPDLGRLGVFWHTQGSGKSYSMACFAEKVRRRLEGNFTFLLMTDRNDLDRPDIQDLRWLWYRRRQHAAGHVGRRSEKAAEGESPLRLQPDPQVQQGCRSEAALQRARRHHRDLGRGASHAGRAGWRAICASRCRTQPLSASPARRSSSRTKSLNASSADYVSRYDFKRSEEDGATVKLVYENRGEKLGVARTDLNDRIAAKIEEGRARSRPGGAAGSSCWVRTTRSSPQTSDLDKVAADFVEHCTTRWESGKSMLICIDKITCARMHQLIVPRWQAQAAVGPGSRPDAKRVQRRRRRATRPVAPRLTEEAQQLAAQTAVWLDETIVEIIISEAQNEVKDFAKWGFDIIPHRARMKQGFETAGRRAR